MKIAIISDIHDNLKNLNIFFEKIENMNIEKIIFLGDLSSAFIAKRLSQSKISVFAILWNNNWDLCRVKDFENEIFYQSWQTFDFLEIDWRKIFLSHYNELAIPMAKSWEYDAVFYGHNHIQHKSIIWNCLVLNPWEIADHRSWKPSFAVYDTLKNDAIFYELYI